jgi:hypothetical protein
MRDLFGWMGTIYLSMWAPLGSTEILPVKPEIGLCYYAHLWRFFGDVHIGFRPGKTLKPFSVQVHDTVHTAGNCWTGIDGGVAVGFEALRFGWQQIDLLFQGGLDGFDAFRAPDRSKYWSIETKYYGPGIGYRYYAGPDRELAIMPRIYYRFSDYSKDGTVKNNLKGNSLYFMVIVGISDHSWRNKRYSALGAENRLRDIKSK